MSKDKKLAQVFHFDLYGKRNEKYSFLQNNTLQTVPWRELELSDPQYFFVQKDFSLKEEYESGFSVQELFPVNSVGIVTARDAIFINYDKRALLKSIKDNLDINPDENLIQIINYRPIDNRYVYYDTKRIERARENVMQHFLKGKNVGLITNKQIRTSHIAHTFITKNVTDLHITETANANPYIFPLYLYPETDKLFSDEKRKPNLNATIINEISQRLGLQFTDEPVDNKGINPLVNSDDRVYINDTQYFDNVPLVAWNFYIGGYQPAQKWLKDRKGRILNFEDIRHYQKMIRVLKETGEVMNEIC